MAEKNKELEALEGAPLARVPLTEPEEDECPLRPSRRAPEKPRGWPSREWYHMAREFRRDHYHCCWIPMMNCPFCGEADPNMNDGCTGTAP